MGPAEFPPGKGIQVRPHPYVGIATITYLFEGEIIHRDSLGFVQPIRPGAVNLMTTGRGILHSERAGDNFDTTARPSTAPAALPAKNCTTCSTPSAAASCACWSTAACRQCRTP